MSTYRATWPILDPSHSLAREAYPDLYRLLTEAGLEKAGPTRWFLVAEVEVAEPLDSPDRDALVRALMAERYGTPQQLDTERTVRLLRTLRTSPPGAPDLLSVSRAGRHG